VKTQKVSFENVSDIFPSKCKCPIIAIRKLLTSCLFRLIVPLFPQIFIRLLLQHKMFRQSAKTFFVGILFFFPMVSSDHGYSGPNYNSLSTGYDAPSYNAPSYNAPKQEPITHNHYHYYGLTPEYSAPKPTYDAPKPSYDPPKPSYNAPSTGYGAPAPSYAAPVPSYGAPAPVYPAPAPTYPEPYAAPYAPDYGKAV